ncbi:unnamed protein product [Brachionus calyciflorus]|uniref:Uncharacterized protein n=1 Tax=Brachionus calyciflorus TaxID=104777 RepID=A0A813MID2_9BILA|nr:unnamed protein product [Brachionus calyciflorus]
MVNINLKYLELLELDNNPIKIIDELIFKKVFLSRIYFNFDLTKFYLSQIIDLSNNNLSLISIGELSVLSNLIELNLANNKIEILEFPILINLQILIFSYNKLKFIKQNTFSKLFNLSELYLTGNLIRFIETNSFIHNKKLKILYLDFNFISMIPEVSSKILNLNNQNGNLVYLDKQAFENKNLNEILLLYNNITYYNPHVFCSNSLKDTKISIDNLNFINKFVLKQNNLFTDIKELQKSYCNEIFKVGFKLFEEKWLNLKNSEVERFLKYFKKEWIDSSNSGCYSGLTHGEHTPAAENALESINGKIKSIHTLRERLSVNSYLRNAFDMLRNWSKDSETEKKFKTSYNVKADTWKMAYEFLYSSDSLIKKFDKKDLFVITEKSYERLIIPDFINRNYASIKKVDFDKLVEFINKIKIININSNDWAASLCSCSFY